MQPQGCSVPSINTSSSTLVAWRWQTHVQALRILSCSEVIESPVIPDQVGYEPMLD
jgi:hypothetical protein